MVRRVALVIAYGPEARSFLQSGLAARLSHEHELVIVTANPKSRAFAGLSAPVLPLPCESEPSAMLRVRAWGRGVRRRAPALTEGSLLAERIAGRWLGGGAWGRFLAEHRIDAIVTASATGGRTLPALQAASNLGLRSAVLLNSWKDLHKRPELPAPVTALGVPPRTKVPSGAAHSAVCGSLHQTAVRRAPAMSRRDFCAATGLDPNRPIVCYATAASDPDEVSRLEWLTRSLSKLAGAPQLLIRTNPMCEDLAPYAALAHRPSVALLRPRWEWSRQRDWNCPLPEDLPWWRAALEHSAAALTLPSTIALDFAAWAKPSVNIAWGAGEAAWSAASYAGIRRQPGTLAATSAEHALALVDDLLRDPPAFAAETGDPVARAAALLQQAFKVSPAPSAAAQVEVAP